MKQVNGKWGGAPPTPPPRPTHPPTHPPQSIGLKFSFSAFGAMDPCSCLLCTQNCIPCSAVVTSVCLMHFGSLYYGYGIYVHEVEEASLPFHSMHVHIPSGRCHAMAEAAAFPPFEIF